MKIEAKIIADSISEAGARITTVQCCYPRFIHSELMTHRAFSRNAMSSRAVPLSKMIEQVDTDPAMPVHWGKNQPGMQAREELDETAKKAAKYLWGTAARKAADMADEMAALGLHKQVANRILEPFQWMHTLITATEWQNFFDLRCHPDAQPEMQALAYSIQHAMQASTPRCMPDGKWHLPYVSEDERNDSFATDLREVSAARCARVSYLRHDGVVPRLQDDLDLFERLAGSAPIHASPLEHQATPMPDPLGASRNFRGWWQFREHREEWECVAPSWGRSAP